MCKEERESCKIFAPSWRLCVLSSLSMSPYSLLAISMSPFFVCFRVESAHLWWWIFLELGMKKFLPDPYSVDPTHALCTGGSH